MDQRPQLVLLILLRKNLQKKSMTVGVATNSREMSNYYHFDSGKDGKLSAAFDANFTKVRYFKMG